jgi:hypothetical protein
MGVLSEVGKLLTLREPLDLPPVLTAYPSRASGFTPGFNCLPFASLWIHLRFYGRKCDAHFFCNRSVSFFHYCVCLWIVNSCVRPRFSLTFIYFVSN